MNVIRNVISELEYVSDDAWHQSVLKVAGGTLLSAVCAYGGTYFFTTHHPLIGAAYFGSVALISQVAYRALEKLKAHLTQAKSLKTQHRINPSV